MDQSASNLASGFTAHSLPLAIGALLEMNNYLVSYDVHMHGAQVDLVATPKGDPFSPKLFVEATVEYVSTAKYGKDTTKFILLQKLEPGCVCLCISSKGFTADVRERAIPSQIQTLTYDELFRKFEKFGEYASFILKDQSSLQLIESYEEPLFNDAKGQQFATRWLGHWKQYSPDESKWLIILGEYGTGKTTLTKVLQNRWLREYREDPSKPIPVRIELRNFSRQFDARGLLHHFLDSNNLGHVSIEFMLHLIRTGRVVLLLDGYDEMAQFLNSRERRACLKALADLSVDGAKGIITSRPNYFTETEELNVFEALYSTLEQSQYYISQSDRTFIDEERAVDELVERYVLRRYERTLQDLTPTQTEALVRRKLVNDPVGQDLILTILRKVFRDEENGKRQALSGKPVIITYLLELVDELRKDGSATSIESYSEWQLYKMILDRLMLRDAGRTSLAAPMRRKALQALALALSARGAGVADEGVFGTIIDDEFRTELRRLSPEERRFKRDELYEELRASATLTRVAGGGKDGYIFSHNSLREYLVVEVLLLSLSARAPAKIRVPITAAMRSFASSISGQESRVLISALTELWPLRVNDLGLGPYLVLLWDLIRRQSSDLKNELCLLTSSREGEPVQLSGVSLRDWDLSGDFRGKKLSLDVNSSDLSIINLSGIDLRGSRFADSVLDGLNFRESNLDGVDFSNAMLFECAFSGCSIVGANFLGVDPDIDILASNFSGQEMVLGGKRAIGYLRYKGGLTDEIEDIFVYQNHPRFPIIQKIAEKLTINRNSQLRGLTQRGEAQADPRFARAFIDRLVSLNWAAIDKNDLVSLGGEGRANLMRLAGGEGLPEQITAFIANWR